MASGYPRRVTSLEQFQYACICVDPVLWAWAHLKEPDHPEQPYKFFDYQEESVRYAGHTLHETASEVGKSREIMVYCLWKAFTVHQGSGLVTAPQTIYLMEIIDMIEEQFGFSAMIAKSLLMHRKQPHHHMRFTSGLSGIFFWIQFVTPSDPWQTRWRLVIFCCRVNNTVGTANKIEMDFERFQKYSVLTVINKSFGTRDMTNSLSSRQHRRRSGCFFPLQ